MEGKYLARRIDNGKVVEGNLICGDGSLFAYILTEENLKKMVVNELKDGETTNCKLTRVLENSIQKITDTNELQTFIKAMVSDIEDNRNFCFDLLRWSKEEPYWCVFACEHGMEGVSVIDGVCAIGGHYCIEKEANLHEVLSILADSGWKMKIHQNFFYDAD